MSGLFASALLPHLATNEMKRSALERELQYRRRVYARRVAEGAMKRSAADYQIWILERILTEGFDP